MSYNPGTIISSNIWDSNTTGTSLVLLSNKVAQGANIGTGLLWSSVRGLQGKSTGKFYFELIGANDADTSLLGISDATATKGVTADGFSVANSMVIRNDGLANLGFTGASVIGGSIGFTGGTGRVIGIAVDVDNKKMWYSDNGVWIASGNPVTGANPYFTWTGVYTVYPFANMWNNTSYELRTFNTVYAPPTGFSVWGSPDQVTAATSIPNVISAGVFSGNELIRTLWSCRPQTLTASSWDGIKDDGSIAPRGLYTIKGITGNVSYCWDGVVGNTNYSGVSIPTRDPNCIQTQDTIYSMAITTSGVMYFCTGYNEARCATYKALLANPHAWTYISPVAFHLTGGVFTKVASDGNYVYWGGFDAFNQTDTGVYATNIASNDAKVTFATYGTDIGWSSNQVTYNIIDHVPAQTALTINSMSCTAGLATANTAIPHNLGTNGTTVVLDTQGAAPDQYNANRRTCTVTGASQFTFREIRDPAAAGSLATAAPAVTTPSVIPMTYLQNSMITGLAVQQTKPYSGVGYLFVARAGMNSIHVLDKTTGQLKQNLTGILNASFCCVCDSDASLWVITGTTRQTASKYTINSTGTLTLIGSIPVTFVLPVALAVSPDNSIVAIADSGTGTGSQQVKFFNNTSPFAATTTNPTLGTSGGYATDPTVTNTKFMFNNPEELTFITNGYPTGLPTSFITFEPTSAGTNPGSFWLGDPGNYRILRFNSSKAYIDQMAWIPSFYPNFLCQNDSTRMFADYREYKIDYSIPLGPNNGSWTLVNNWGFGHYGTVYAIGSYSTLANIVTLFDGSVYRTYALAQQVYSPWLIQTIELVTGPGGGIRFTGESHTSSLQLMDPDGRRSEISPNNIQANVVIGGPIQWKRQPVTFSAGNPSWGTAVVETTSPPIGVNDPVSYCQNWTSNQFATTGGVLALYDGRVDNNAVGAIFTGRIDNGVTPGTTGTVLTISNTNPTPGTAYPNGYAMQVGATIIGAAPGTLVVSFGTGNGGDGTYNVNIAQSLPSTASMKSRLWAHGYHLGGIDKTTGAWRFRVSPAPPSNFGTEGGNSLHMWPQDGYFNTGSVVNASGSCLVQGEHILYQYYGEGWVANNTGPETNKWRHYHETGLMVGEFGVACDATINPSTGIISNANNQIGMAGNAFYGSFCIVNGIGYVYHNDEGFKAGIHRWRISDLDSVKINSFQVNLNY